MQIFILWQTKRKRKLGRDLHRRAAAPLRISWAPTQRRLSRHLRPRRFVHRRGSISDSTWSPFWPVSIKRFCQTSNWIVAAKHYRLVTFFSGFPPFLIYYSYYYYSENMNDWFFQNVFLTILFITTWKALVFGRRCDPSKGHLYLPHCNRIGVEFRSNFLRSKAPFGWFEL